MSVFETLDYREFVAAQLPSLRGKLRQAARKCELTTPNQLQQVITGRRHLTPKQARSLGHFLGLGQLEIRFLQRLVEYDRASAGDKDRHLRQLRSLLLERLHPKEYDENFHKHWLHQVIFECSRLQPFRLEVAKKKLSHIASSAMVEDSWNFLVKRGYFQKQGHRWLAQPRKFSSPDNLRNLDVRRNHLQFLDIAKRRTSDRIADRSFQGLTMAFPRKKMPELNRRLAQFLDEIEAEGFGHEDCDDIVRVQLSAFFLTQSGD